MTVIAASRPRCAGSGSTIAHAEVVLGPAGGRWLPVINANGARMGGPSRFSERQLTRLLRGLGYRVLRSGPDPTQAARTASQAWTGCLAGERIAWISVTDKGWPAPDTVNGQPYRGHLAHKAPPAA